MSGGGGGGGSQSHDPSNGCYTGHEPVQSQGYSSRRPSSARRNMSPRRPRLPVRHDSAHSQQDERRGASTSRHPQSHADGVVGNGFSRSDYDDRPREQVRPSRPTSTQHQSLMNIVSTVESIGSSLSLQPLLGTINVDDPLLDYSEYTMPVLIQKLVPTETYIPERSFVYAMLMCSRMNIRTTALFNHLTNSTWHSLPDKTRAQSRRTKANFLSILSQWTRTFPYDFRNTEMFTQLEDILQRISVSEPRLQSNAIDINVQLQSKLKALEQHEEYIRQLNEKASENLHRNALLTDVVRECPTPILFARQLAHIELDRLKPIGAEELIQYYIAKLASEEARANPDRFSDRSASTTDSLEQHGSSKFAHDQKLTFCLEAYIHWFNALTRFVTIETLKHTKRRLRIAIINYFIDAAYECFRLRNFNSMFAILGGLSMQPVKRLKRTWKKIPTTRLEELDQYTNVSKNFACYRATLKDAMEEAEQHGWTADKLVIPITSIVLQDVYFIKTHSEDYTAEGGINLKKYYSMAKCIAEEFLSCKQSKCSFERNDVIINYIVTSPTFDDDALMRASFECEPPTTPREKTKWASLRQTT